MMEHHQCGTIVGTSSWSCSTYLAWLCRQEVVSFLEQDGEGGGGVMVLHGGLVIVPHLGVHQSIHTHEFSQDRRRGNISSRGGKGLQ